MDGWVRVLRPFNSISVTSRRWKGEHERLCAMKCRLGSGRISPPFGSGEEDFLRFLPYMGIVVILVMWPGPFEQNFVPPSHGGSIWNLTLIGQAVSELKMFKECGWRRTTDDDGGQRPTYTISSPNEPKGSGELKSGIYRWILPWRDDHLILRGMGGLDFIIIFSPLTALGIKPGPVQIYVISLFQLKRKFIQ